MKIRWRSWESVTGKSSKNLGEGRRPRSFIRHPSVTSVACSHACKGLKKKRKQTTGTTKAQAPLAPVAPVAALAALAALAACILHSEFQFDSVCQSDGPSACSFCQAFRNQSQKSQSKWSGGLGTWNTSSSRCQAQGAQCYSCYIYNIYIYILVVVFLCYSYVLTGLISFDEVSTCRVARPEQGLQSVWTLREIKNNQDGGVPGKVLYNDLN